jgi:hypothetical protein
MIDACQRCDGRGFVKLCSVGTIADIKGSIAGRVTGREDQLWSLCKCLSAKETYEEEEGE